MNKISVIIPMYNAEPFIRQCIRSVTNQTYHNLEILVIDDGSTDGGPDICGELKAADERIRILRQENLGVSAARNHGLDAAQGEYVFFLDSDDAIHLLLLEEMLHQAEGQNAGLAFCDYKRLDSEQLEMTMNEASVNDRRGQWQVADATEAEQWFHLKYVNKLSGIGGKLIHKALIGKQRFDEGLSNGEDTLFLYNIISTRLRAAYLQRDWYYYRMHTESVTHSAVMVRGMRYFECSRRIRDYEYQRGNTAYALTWEGYVVRQMQRNYMMLRRGGYRGGRGLKKTASIEWHHPLFRHLFFDTKLLFCCCFICYPLYYPLNAMVSLLWKIKESVMMSGRDAETGILTFHCSNNYGAMLQAYGLKTFLCESGVPAQIVRYAPPFMTGRHWFMPYVPPSMKGCVWSLKNMLGGFWFHLRTREEYARRKANMNRFRKERLIDKRQPRFLFSNRLKRLPYRYYIVGSDQVWNPDITCGMRKAYFGAFPSKRKKKVISYGASFGGASLPPRYDREFAELIKHVDVISVREKEAIPYVKRFYEGEVTAVLDPVFFLDRNSWQKVERLPESERYILVYITEPNTTLADYAKTLSARTGLEVIEVRSSGLSTKAGFTLDSTAGPAEFLGYVHKAEYVVTNSFHGVALSIIFRKRFLAFAHSNLSARLMNILQIHGLEDRICREGEIGDIDASVDWEQVEQKTAEAMEQSAAFLLKNISE